MGYGFAQTSNRSADGNKNVIALYDTDGILMASYSYGPFGQLLSASGPLAQINPFRFSSEYFDDETDLVYYNYRYYSPRLGRWLSRDPIGETGGLNLYGMLGNDAVNVWDKLGLDNTAESFPGEYIGISAEAWRLIRYSAPQPPVSKKKQTGCCGKNVTKNLNRLIAYLATELIKPQYADLFINRGYDSMSGWDIDEFTKEGQRSGYSPIFGGKGGCEQTAAYNGKCYKTTALNYVLYGLLTRIEEYHTNSSWALEQSLLLSSTYSIGFGTLRETYFMLLGRFDQMEEGFAFNNALKRIGGVYAGYTGDFDYIQYENCTVNNDNVYTGVLTARIGVNKFEVS